VCPQQRLVIISYTTGLSFALERIGPLAAITFIVFYLLVLYLLVLPNTPKNSFASIYSESLIKTTCQHLLLLVGFDTLIYQKYYDTPPILVGHQDYFPMPLSGSEALLKSGIGKGNCRWILCRKNTGYHATDPKIRTQGAEHGRSWIATKHGDGSLESSNAQHTVERDAEPYPGSGPSW
jgi:hypothetical protein